MWETSDVRDAIKLRYSEVDGAKTNADMDGTEIMDNNRPRATEDKVDIVTREKQIKDAKSKIYYAPKQE